MVNVAIAGGTGGVGRTIVEVMKGNLRHKAFVLSRRPLAENIGSPSIQVDYDDVAALTRVLEENKIHTVISAFGYHGDSLSKAQNNLIRAATASSESKRFVPSTFAISYPADAVAELDTLKDYFGAIEELKKSGMQWTVFLNGCFLDYWGMPHIKTYLRPTPFVIDVEHRIAAIPGDGNSPVTFTYSFDVARFVVASLDLPEWPEESRIAGDTVTWNEFVQLAEEALGCRFDVSHDSLEDLEKSKITELPSQIPLYESFPKAQFQWFIAIFERWTADEKISKISGELNKKFPDIQPMTVRAMLDQCWKGK